MNIGIIVYSQTGNTLAVAQRIKDTCIAAGHTADVQQITVENPHDSGHMSLVNAPSAEGYDALILGAPVQAFSLCRAMTLYLRQLPKLKGVPAGYYITHGLPKLWMGGSRAYKSLRSLCLKKGAAPVQLGDVYWKSDQRDELIAGVVSAAAKFAATATGTSK
ncbi:MAG TPA: flavodoxin [Candidatus Limiplasma sp.]|nr:flavodoxin [Candidatus Limiplasma sp.]